VKATTARYTAEELIAKREEVKKQIHELLQSQMTPANLELTETYITDFQFSQGFSHAVEAKQIAEQEAFKAKRDLDRIKIEAEQKVATAQAEARALALQREAITANLIELRRIEAQRLAIEKWDGHLPQTMMGGSSMPMVDLSQLNGKAK
jgi:regulator of protease activity HflC (stomatin/prohibitin superfamily)